MDKATLVVEIGKFTVVDHSELAAMKSSNVWAVARVPGPEYET